MRVDGGTLTTITPDKQIKVEHLVIDFDTNRTDFFEGESGKKAKSDILKTEATSLPVEFKKNDRV